MINHLAASGYFIFSTSIVSALVMFARGYNRKICLMWGLFSLSVASWGFGLIKAFTTNTESVALFWGRYLNLSAAFIPLFFFHFVVLFTDQISKRKRELSLYYLTTIGYVLACLLMPLLFIPNVKSFLNYVFYPAPGPLYYFLLLFFTYLVIYGIVLLFQDFSISAASKKNQIKYILFGVICGFSGGSMTFFPVFNIKIQPYGTYFVPLYVVTVAYAIIRYRLLDINIALTRAGIFIFVYAVVLGVPFGLAAWRHPWLENRYGDGWFWIPMFILLTFASIGPFVYRYLTKKAEDMLLMDQKRYHDILRRFSALVTLI